MTTSDDSASNAVADLLARVEVRRQQTASRLDSAKQREYGQFFTPRELAERIAAQLRLDEHAPLLVLDPGAGVGVLATAVVARTLLEQPGRSLHITAVEIDPDLRSELEETLNDCRQIAQLFDTHIEYTIVSDDFINWGTTQSLGNLYHQNELPKFDIVIQNPPYGKLSKVSSTRRNIARFGVEVPNMYAAFLALSIKLLKPKGQLAAITPRSFCNGTYFREFRRFLLSHLAFDQISVFHERGTLFAESAVLQETIIFSGTRDVQPVKVAITSSRAHEGGALERIIPYSELVHPNDKDNFIRIPTDNDDDLISQIVSSLESSLHDLGVQVSTGKVVDFRSREFIQPPSAGLVPLIYPRHMTNGRIAWPIEKKSKPDSIVNVRETEKLLLPAGTYVLVKRLSSKEEVRRVVASVYRPSDITDGPIAFENHLNVFHDNNRGIDEHLAIGLTGWLNSSMLDLYFRQFSGHTQVNATDLRAMRYPPVDVLTELGRAINIEQWPEQTDLDSLVEQHILGVTAVAIDSPKELHQMEDRVSEARRLLDALNFDAERSNERSALVLLALAGLGPSQSWHEASNPMLRTVEIMDFLRQRHKRDYKPNTRETIRRRTLHQFAEAGLIVQNPDQPNRPVNSPKWCYQLTDHALKVIKTFGSEDFQSSLSEYLAELPGLVSLYAAEREMVRIPIAFPDGRTITISGGGQNVLLKSMVDSFCPLFTPGGIVLYIGDADNKWVHFEQEYLTGLGIDLNRHGKMPDLVVYMPNRNWLVLLEATTWHGPIDAKRYGELQTLFAGSTAGLVFVSCFPDRATMRTHLADIAWETEVWCADTETHMIHFNGERFLGPYEKK